jgi:hypothetical protein
VEGSVKVEAVGGKAATIKPGEKVLTGSDLSVKPMDASHMAALYRFFSKLDSKEELARDLGITVAKLEIAMNPPAAPPVSPMPAAGAAPPPARPKAGPRIPSPGELEIPDISEEKPVDGMSGDGISR